MLAIGIKNSILVLLIILILHFLIKNTIFDKNGKAPKKVQQAPTDIKKVHIASVPTVDIMSSQPAKVQVETFKNESLSCEASPPRNTDLEKEELLKFVFGAEAPDTSEDELKKYFKGDDVTSDVEGELAKIKPTCPPVKKDDMNLPLSTTCDPQIQRLNLLEEKSVKGDCNLKQDKKDIMILKEYDDENSMSGGELYGGLSAFDNLASAFEEYNSVCNFNH